MLLLLSIISVKIIINIYVASLLAAPPNTYMLTNTFV